MFSQVNLQLYDLGKKGDLSCWEPIASGVGFSGSFGYYYKLVTLNPYQRLSAHPCAATSMMKSHTSDYYRLCKSHSYK